MLLNGGAAAGGAAGRAAWRGSRSSGGLRDLEEPASTARFPDVIESLLPGAAAVVEVFGDVSGAALYPQEQEQVKLAVDRRVREFATVRHCARRGLARLGVAPAPILSDEHGAPLWPEGIVGSMTHTHGYRAAAVARATDLASLGMDAEPHEPLPAEILAMVGLPDELRHLKDLAEGTPEVSWDRLLFCAKEAVYKAWYPLTGAWLDFEEASIRFTPGAFFARLLVPGPVLAGTRLTGFAGRWKVEEGFVFAAVCVPAVEDCI
jgi:4'-phosphopantetheinyl transferase EntD